MWNILRLFFAKFFSSDLMPVEPMLTPDTTAEPEKSPVPEPVLGRLTKSFMASEFSCNDENKTPVPDIYTVNVKKLAANLQVLRDVLGKPIKVTSGYRTKEYNTKVGGVKNSQHLFAKAADIKVKGMSSKRLANKIKKLIDEGKMSKGGIGVYKTFVHYDIRGENRKWYGKGVNK
jgi:hypothetical protein